MVRSEIKSSVQGQIDPSMKTKARLQKPSDKNCKRKALDLPMDVTATTMALIIISKMIYSCLTYGLPAAGGRLPLRMVVPRVHHIFTSPSTILRKRYLGFKGILLPSANCAVKTTLCDGIGHGFADGRFDGGVVRQCAVAVRAYLLCKTMSLHNIDVPSHAQIRPRLDPATSDQGGGGPESIHTSSRCRFCCFASPHRHQ